MIYKKIPLDEFDESFYLECFVAERLGAYVRKALLIIPGGGYSAVCADREGEPTAMAFLPHGYNCFVLHYSVGKKPFPCQLIQASRAMHHIRTHAQAYGVDADKVFVVGFSAGGHLAACLGTMWHQKEIYEAAGIPFGSNRPAGMMLMYPLVSARSEDESFVNLWLGELTRERGDRISIENYVDEHTVPAFIVHTVNDDVVHVRHTLILMDALTAHGISFEAHVFPDAPHGIALGNAITSFGNPKWENEAIAKWVEQAIFWAEHI